MCFLLTASEALVSAIADAGAPLRFIFAFGIASQPVTIGFLQQKCVHSLLNISCESLYMAMETFNGSHITMKISQELCYASSRSKYQVALLTKYHPDHHRATGLPASFLPRVLPVFTKGLSVESCTVKLSSCASKACSSAKRF